MSDSAAALIEVTKALKELATHEKEIKKLAADSDDDDVDDFVRKSKRQIEALEKHLKRARVALGG
jgi:hypothetical protein